MKEKSIQIETNHGHDWATVTVFGPENEFEVCNNSVEISFTGRDPVSVTLRYNDMRDVRAIGQALIEAANYLAPDEQQRNKLADRLIALRSAISPDNRTAWDGMTEIAEALRKIGD